MNYVPESINCSSHTFRPEKMHKIIIPTKRMYRILRNVYRNSETKWTLTWWQHLFNIRKTVLYWFGSVRFGSTRIHIANGDGWSNEILFDQRFTNANTYLYKFSRFCFLWFLVSFVSIESNSFIASKSIKVSSAWAQLTTNNHTTCNPQR